MRIAVVGTGIAGMVAAHLLCKDHDVVVFEANDYIGGHTHTIDVALDGKTYPVDTGFIVFNEKTYPNFIKLMKRLDVSWQPSDMSFSIRCDKTGLEFSPRSLNALFAQRRNFLRPAFYRMLLDVFRFRRQSEELLKKQNDTITLGAYLASQGFSRVFRDHFIIPLGEAIWSADPFHFNEFPARYFVQFFKNHGFLNVRNQPQWLVIQGGSKRYVEPLTQPYHHRIYLNCPVKSVKRNVDSVEVKSKDGKAERFDHVVIAAHSDQALAMLADPSDKEQEILETIGYQENLATLHTDASLLPRRKVAWSSWNYRIPQDDSRRVAVTYNMNILQSLHAPQEFCVTLNLPKAIAPSKILKSMVYHHPVYTIKSLEARKRHQEINGINRTFFCGAYWGYGFHEDGVNSALSVCQHFGKTI